MGGVQFLRKILGGNQMKKYLGLLKLETESFTGVSIRILTKFSNSKSVIKKWMKLYSDSANIILDNNELLDEFFKDFEDYTPITDEEKTTAQKLYEEFIKQQD